jgi:hypothetical protein
MKTTKTVLFMFMCLPAMVFAGEIFGTITQGGKPFARQQVKITTKDGTVLKTDSTDALGYFSINIKQTGQFKLQAGGAVADVFSNNSPTGYTFILVQNKSVWQLIQK